MKSEEKVKAPGHIFKKWTRTSIFPNISDLTKKIIIFCNAKSHPGDSQWLLENVCNMKENFFCAS